MTLKEAAKLPEKKCPGCKAPMQKPVEGSKLPAEKRWFCKPCDRYFPKMRD